MASPDTIAGAGRSDWMLMTAIHDALRCGLDQLLYTPASCPVWGNLRAACLPEDVGDE